MYTVKHRPLEKKVKAVILAKVQFELQEEDEIKYKMKKEKLALEKLQQNQIVQNNDNTFSYVDHAVNSNYGLSSSSFASGYKSNGIVLYKW